MLASDGDPLELRCKLGLHGGGALIEAGPIARASMRREEEALVQPAREQLGGDAEGERVVMADVGDRGGGFGRGFAGFAEAPATAPGGIGGRIPWATSDGMGLLEDFVDRGEGESTGAAYLEEGAGRPFASASDGVRGEVLFDAPDLDELIGGDLADVVFCRKDAGMAPDTTRALEVEGLGGMLWRRWISTMSS
ncbi:MAG: hypothetical protein IPK80_00585 [Nannocystis sp.]|nr:hypothetical protein [Nannocystis sp.]